MKSHDRFRSDGFYNLSNFDKAHKTMSKVVVVIMCLGFVSILVIVFLNVSMRATGQYQEHAVNQARAWTNEMYPNEISHISCQNADTDDNGYVSCTIRVGDHPPMGIECSVPMSMNNGCRIPLFQNVIQRQSQ